LAEAEEFCEQPALVGVLSNGLNLNAMNELRGSGLADIRAAAGGLVRNDHQPYSVALFDQAGL
jgi:hypothetical protein